jgi:hypothetical protein
MPDRFEKQKRIQENDIVEYEDPAKQGVPLLAADDGTSVADVLFTKAIIDTMPPCSCSKKAGMIRRFPAAPRPSRVRWILHDNA